MRLGANNDARKEENEKGKRKSEKEWIGLQRVNRLSTWREIQRCQTDDTMHVRRDGGRTGRTEREVRKYGTNPSTKYS